MCQLNLDAYQSQVNRAYGTDFELPILYFTQLMGLAFGLDAAALGLGKEIVSAEKALAKVGRRAAGPARGAGEAGRPEEGRQDPAHAAAEGPAQGA